MPYSTRQALTGQYTENLSVKTREQKIATHSHRSKNIRTNTDQETVNSKFNISTGAQLESPALGRFYKRNGHKGKIQPNDICFWIERDQAIVAAARLQPVSGERNSLLLRGLWVDKAQRRKRLGSELLERITHYLQGQQRDCFCLAYCHLETFYTEQRFNRPAIESCPTELIAQYHRYKKRGNNLTLLLYSA